MSSGPGTLQTLRGDDMELGHSMAQKTGARRGDEEEKEAEEEDIYNILIWVCLKMMYP